MVFASVEFLSLLLPLTLVAYALCSVLNGSARLLNAILLTASLLFYFWGGGAYTLILLSVILGNYLIGLIIHRFDGQNDTVRKWALAMGIVFNLCVLGYYKYIGFVAVQSQLLPEWLPRLDPALAKIILPIGISFYIFQAISYLIDVYRRDAAYQSNLLNFALYIAMFPQLIAGPIVRYALIADQLDNRDTKFSSTRFADGATRFCIGVAKKVIIADTLAVVANAVYEIPNGDMSAATAWIGLLAYTFQIYFDFSGYSDMAIGLGLMFGFRFPENFNRPYASMSITDFWRRWHMTLSSWFRDYLYIPLGGSRCSSWRTYANLWIVFMATGLWHGANWTFIVWGAYHGAWLILERVFGLNTVEPRASSLAVTVFRRLGTFLIVCLGWNLFRANDLTHAGQLYRSLFGGSVATPSAQVSEHLTNYFMVTFALACALVLISQFASLRSLIMEQHTRIAQAGRLFIVGGAFPYAIMLMVSGTFSAFIYYQF